MTTKRVVYKRSDGVIEVVVPTQPAMALLLAAGKTEDEAMEFIQDDALKRLPGRGFGPPGNVEVMEAALVPQTQPGNRTFRNALEKPGMGPPIVNMPKARVIKTDLIREDRDARLKVEDIEIMKATERGDTTAVAEIAARKQALRDLPATIQPDLDAIADPEVLEAWQPVWP